MCFTSLFLLNGEKIDYLLKKYYFCTRMFKLDETKIERMTSGERAVQCGPLECVFEVKLYRFKDYGIRHQLYRHPSLEDDVFLQVDNELLN